MLPGYTHRTKISIDPINIIGDLIDFPVAVVLRNTNFDFAGSLADGHDIRFTASDGVTLLDFERDRHDSVTGRAEYQVKVPAISSVAPTEIYLYQRTTATVDGANPTAVWDSSAKSRWGLGQDPAGGTGAITDSTINAKHGTAHEMTSADSVEGKIGQALDFDGVNDYVEVPYSATLNPSVFTVEAWARVTGGVGAWRSVISSRDAVPIQGYIIYAGNDNLWQFWIGNETGWRRVNGLAVVLDQWVHLVACYDGTEARFYADGTLVGSLATTLLVNPRYQLRIGAGATAAPNFFFNGLIDEVRISNTARSPAWIKASHHSGNNTLLTFGGVEQILQTKLNAVSAIRTNLAGSGAVQTKLSAVSAIRTNLAGSKLLQTKLNAVSAIRTNITGSGLLQTKLNAVSVIRANIAGTELLQTKLNAVSAIRTNITGSGLLQTKLNTVSAIRTNLFDITGATYIRAKRRIFTIDNRRRNFTIH